MVQSSETPSHHCIFVYWTKICWVSENQKPKSIHFHPYLRHIWYFYESVNRPFWKPTQVSFTCRKSDSHPLFLKTPDFTASHFMSFIALKLDRCYVKNWKFRWFCRCEVVTKTHWPPDVFAQVDKRWRVWSAGPPTRGENYSKALWLIAKGLNWQLLRNNLCWTDTNMLTGTWCHVFLSTCGSLQDSDCLQDGYFEEEHVNGGEVPWTTNTQIHFQPYS